MLGGPLLFVGGVSGGLPRVRDRVGGRDRGLIMRGCCGGDLRCGSGLHAMPVEMLSAEMSKTGAYQRLVRTS